MRNPDIQSVNTLLKRHSDNPTLQSLRVDLESAQQAELSTNKLDTIISIYKQALPIIEKTLWSSEIDDSLVSQYQNSFHELEQFISLRGNDNRHSFIIVIPVADRPRHLSKCLESLLKLCQCYQYGGFSSQEYSKVSVIVADDSANERNIQQHKDITQRFSKLGLRTEHFGLEKQIELVSQLKPEQQQGLSGIIGKLNPDCDTASFGHKGASIMRNITYLRLNQIINDINRNKTLIYFIDSDQEFCVNAPSQNGSKNVYAINYFHHLDEIFSQNDVSILTGKVVGDPPVSPAVMAGTFQDDIINFLHDISETKPEQKCLFHQVAEPNDDAAYHDMANLFGFDHSEHTFQYNCTLPNNHDNQNCLNDFAKKLGHFFHGEHPTRPSYFNYKSKLSTTTPARTIYTGNYVFRPENLKFFISFADLKLRMAGPTLGRIIKSETGDKFVSANLPMLHTRTVENTGQSEFRPGVLADDNHIDLSDEFVRQYFGDVMLFTVEELSKKGYPKTLFSVTDIRKALDKIEPELLIQYMSKQALIMQKHSELKQLFNDETKWWNQTTDSTQSRKLFSQFLDNIEKNFGAQSAGYALISSAQYKATKLEQILQAITGYTSERTLWKHVIK
jgi:hypothetical protein